MAACSSRVGAKILLRNCRCWNVTESVLSRDVLPALGGAGAGVRNQGFGVGSIRRATFDASSGDQHSNVPIGSGNSDPIKPLVGGNFEVSMSGRKFPSQTHYGRLGFGRACRSLSTSPAPKGRPPVMRTAADGSQKVIARISNVPRFVFKSDLLWLLKGCNLTPEDFLYIYDSKCRIKFIEIQLPSIESFQLAQKSLASKGRFGGRYLKLTSEAFQMDDVNKLLGPFRGRSLFLPKVAIGAMTDDVERLFYDFKLDSNYPIRFLRSPVRVPAAVSRIPGVPVKTEYEQRALVRFRTEFEALRALREKQGAICLDTPTDLRFIS